MNRIDCTTDYNLVFNSLKSDKFPEFLNGTPLGDALLDYFNVYLIISNSWKNGLKVDVDVSKWHDRAFSSLKTFLPPPSVLPAVCRQLPDTLLYCEIESTSLDEIIIPAAGSVRYSDVLHIVSATPDYLRFLWQPFYDLSKARSHDVANYVVATSEVYYSECVDILKNYDDVDVLAFKSRDGACLSEDTHSFKSLTRFMALCYLIHNDIGMNFMVTDLDALVPKGFDWTFPEHYGDMRLRYWNSIYPFHWRNVSAGLSYFRNTDNSKYFAKNFCRTINVFQSTRLTSLCGDQMAFESALRFVSDDTKISCFNDKLEAWYGPLEQRKLSMIEYANATMVNQK